MLMLLDPIHWLQFVWAALPWYANMQLLALAALPLTMRVASRLPDRGYALAKALGLVLTCYITWILAHRVMPFEQRTVGVAALVVATVSFIGLALGWRDIFSFFCRRWPLVLLYELIFLLAFGLMLSIRSLTPNITYVIQDSAAEKFTDFAILTGLLNSRWFPPHDAWLSGETINYYYFGHFLWASLTKLSEYKPEIGFNLALASIFAYTCIQAFSLGYNLTRRIGLGFLAMFLIAVASNIDGFFQVLGIAGAWLDGAFKGQSYSWYSTYDFWRSSRAVENTINEFPAFSFILGDLHAHLSSLVIFLAAMLLLIQIWKSVSRERSLLQYEFWHLDELFLASVLAGALYAANSWDAITFSALFCSIVFAARIRCSRDGARISLRLAYAVESLLLGAVVVFIGVAVFFRFFGSNFQAPFDTHIMRIDKWPFLRVKEFPVRVVAVVNRTSTLEFLTHWIMLLLLPMIVVISWIISSQKKQVPAARERFFGVAALIVALCLVAFTFSAGWVGSITLSLAIATLVIMLTRNLAVVPRLLCALLLVFFVLTWFCEFFYLDDIFDGPIERINTVFKLYYGLWPIMVCASVLALRRLLRFVPRFAKASIILLVLFGAAYPVFGVMQRYENSRIFRARSLPVGAPLLNHLNGLNYLKDVHSDDYAAIMWVREKVPASAVILEAVGRQYEYSSRFGTITGRQSYGGWLYHEWGWRGNRWTPERDRRTAAAETIYITADPAQAHELLMRDRIEFVVIGSQERSVYGPVMEYKFDEIGDLVFKRGETSIYKVDKDATPKSLPTTALLQESFIDELETSAILLRTISTTDALTTPIETQTTRTTELEISTTSTGMTDSQ